MSLRLLLFAAVLALPAVAQIAAPVIARGGIVNAASYRPAVAPGSIAAVFGEFPVASGVWATEQPLPAALAELSLQFNSNLPVPLFFVSARQANAQVPWELAGRSAPALAGHASGLAGREEQADVIAFAPGIFSVNQQGSGPGAVLDAAYRPVDSTNPVGAGDTILIYCTGLGPVTNRPATGSAALSAPLSETTTRPAVEIGGAPAEVLWSGLAPGLVGAYQVNAVVPAAAAAGEAVPVTISAGGYTSNTVTIAVRPPSPLRDPDARALSLLSRMTLDEKLQMVRGRGGPVTNIIPLPRGAAGWVQGIPRLGIPDLYLADGSNGVGNGAGPSTALPASIASAAAWDLDLAYRYGRVIGAEMRAHGMNVNLGGNINLTREPRNGRTFETKGEDPLLAGRITAAHLRAIQDQHVVAGLKHFALNDQETGRTTADVRIGERGARQSDLLAFEIALKESGVQSVMCSYNLVNGAWACENPHLLNDILKGDWGFRGFVMSDWWATHSTVPAALAGLDQEQPDSAYFGAALRQAVADGRVPLSRLDDMVLRILRAMFASGLFDHPDSPAPVDRAAGEAVAQATAEQGAVLLKNAGGQLPLDRRAVRSIAVIGGHADRGVLSGGGSARVTPFGPYFTEGYPCPPCWADVVWVPSAPLAAIRAMAPGANVRFDDGSDAARAAVLAASSEVAVVFVTQWESEGMDRPGLNFTDVIHATAPRDQDALVAAVAAANPRTVVVLENGGPVAMPWLDRVSAVLEAWYPGQRGGEAVANLLFGEVNPSGKLPMTFPASAADLPRPAIPSGRDGSTPFRLDYSEGFHVGYKWYESRGIVPLFPFGFGLSYTTFEITNARLEDDLASPRRSFRVVFDLRNTGPVAGAEVAQVYIGFPAGMGEPPRRLAGWQKVLLEAGALQHVTIEVRADDASHALSYWDEGGGGWRTGSGEYTVYLGSVPVGTLH